MEFAVSDTGVDECMREGRWLLGLMKLEMKAADGGKARVGRPGKSALDRLRQVIDSQHLGPSMYVMLQQKEQKVD
ncbi:sulfide quinone reductase [Aspergillus luchuensis]|uniref:Sulfide quinone reductase n=1 Tax=Aspergillus kawachii TaxID=1069201 RepID=A0A146FBZ5_ASPKA|nr:sulfide quinone reductase [Aspergillus luchuensis]